MAIAEATENLLKLGEKKLSAHTSKAILRRYAYIILPPGLRLLLRELLSKISHWPLDLSLARLRGKMQSASPGTVVQCLDYIVRINDGPNFYILYKDLFVRQIYHFVACGPDPVILDCGSNIGLSILYFKHLYPLARIIGFEPDTGILPYLEENIAANHLDRVELVRAALAGHTGKKAFYSDAKYGSYLAQDLQSDSSKAGSKVEVPCVRLRDYLGQPVDFLKMNIEGAEYEVLADTKDYLRQIKEMVVEYHHLPGLPRTLHHILALLHECGFEYLINDFDSETNQETLPPFHLGPESRYFLLIYARRLD